MFIVKYRKRNSTQITEDIFIRVLGICDGCVGLDIHAPTGTPVAIEQAVVCLAPGADKELPGRSKTSMSAD